MFSGIREMTPGKTDDALVMVKSVTTAVDRNNNTYQKLLVRDANGGEGSLLKFDDPVDLVCPVVIRCRVECSPCPKILTLEVMPDLDIISFQPKPHVSARACWNKVLEVTRTMRPSLQGLVQGVLFPRQQPWMSAPLDESGAYARITGTAEASVRLLSLARNAGRVYTMDTDLLTAGALLYYVGHIHLLDRNFVKTPQGHMTDPGAVAFGMVEETAGTHRKETGAERPEGKPGTSPFEEDVFLLENILLSSTGSASPLTREAVCLKRLDAMSREMDRMTESVRSGTPGTIVETRSTVWERVYCPVFSSGGRKKSGGKKHPPEQKSAGSGRRSGGTGETRHK